MEIYTVYMPDPLSGELEVVPLDRNAKCAQLWLQVPKPKHKARMFKASGVSFNPEESLPQRCAQWLSQATQDSAQHLMAPTNKLLSYFSDGPYPPDDAMIDIIVVNDEVIANLDIVGMMMHGIVRAQHEAQEHLKLGPSPSDVVTNIQTMRNVLEAPDTPHHFGRPESNYGLPTSIYSLPLARLKFHIDNPDSIQVESQDLNDALSYCSASLRIFDSENDCDAVTKDHLTQLIGCSPLVKMFTEDNNTKPGRRWEQGGASYVIEEGKNETGHHGDPFLQGVISYEKCIMQPKCAKFVTRCNMPTMLFAMSSAQIEVSVAIFTDGVYVDKLLSLDFYMLFHSAQVIVRLAKAMVTIKRCAAELRQFYHEVSLRLDKPVDTNLPHLFPMPNPLPEAASRFPKLKFLSNLSQKNGTPISHCDGQDRSHGLFLAEDLESGDEVVVKFTTWYSVRAHCLLAEAKPKALAPALHSCMRAYGDVYMVVMAHIKGENLWFVDKPYPQYALANIHMVINLLHAEDLVFGDLQDTNVVLMRQEKRAFFIDFDRCDVHQQGHYPPLVNKNVYGADSGIKRGGIMLKDHNMLQLLRMEEHFQGQAD